MLMTPPRSEEWTQFLIVLLTSSVLLVTSYYLCASNSSERQREQYIRIGSLQEANEATSEEASGRVPDTTNPIALSLTFF